MCVCFLLQNTKHYELLNYSEHGTTVDNVLYSCDFSEKASPSPPSGLVAKVQGIIRKSPSVWTGFFNELCTQTQDAQGVVLIHPPGLTVSWYTPDITV